MQSLSVISRWKWATTAWRAPPSSFLSCSNFAILHDPDCNSSCSVDKLRCGITVSGLLLSSTPETFYCRGSTQPSRHSFAGVRWSCGTKVTRVKISRILHRKRSKLWFVCEFSQNKKRCRIITGAYPIFYTKKNTAFVWAYYIIRGHPCTRRVSTSPRPAALLTRPFLNWCLFNFHSYITTTKDRIINYHTCSFSIKNVSLWISNPFFLKITVSDRNIFDNAKLWW